MYEEEVSRLQRIIDDSGNIVFFGGAGVSTESNIPDFRSADGLYLQKYKYSPEQIVSHSFFVSRTEDFYEFYKNKMMFLDAKPNPAHCSLPSWKRLASLRRLSPRILTDFTRRQEAGTCWNCTGVFCAITARDAASPMMRPM